jgi:hypothetical protein
VDSRRCNLRKGERYKPTTPQGLTLVLYDLFRVAARWPFVRRFHLRLSTPLAPFGAETNNQENRPGHGLAQP